MQKTLLPALERYLSTLPSEFPMIPTDRRELLEDWSSELQKSREASEPLSLLFICTHNSRRSHLAQLWAAALAWRFGWGTLQSFSGGTEITALHPNAVAALYRAGWEGKSSGKVNPRYALTFSQLAEPIIAYSKRYDAPENPKSSFWAVMTCDHADEHCPFIYGAAKRIALHYADPKIADGSPDEAAVYDERCRQIARELFFVFSRES